MDFNLAIRSSFFACDADTVDDDDANVTADDAGGDTGGVAGEDRLGSATSR